MPEVSQKSCEDSDNPQDDEVVKAPDKTGINPTTKVIALAVIVVLLIAVPMGYLLMSKDDSEDEDNGDTVLTIQANNNSVNLTMRDLQLKASVTAAGGWKKTTGTIEGPFEFTGVRVADLVDIVCDDEKYSLEVIASDGYTMTYACSQTEDGTFAHYNLDGSLGGTGTFAMIMAYAQNGSPLVDMDLRIAIVDDSEPITDGHFWVKSVTTIRVVEPAQEWSLELNGTTSMIMDMATFESIASCEYHSLSYTFENETGEHTYTGVALWTLVSAVDDADGPDTEYLFNDLLAFAGYSVRVSADDDYSKTFSSMQVARNDSIIVANKLDGESLPAEEYPLKLVGDWLSSGQKIKRIVNISLEELQPVADWELTIIGTRTITLTAGTFASTYYSGLHGPWFNYTNYGGWHAAYYNYTEDMVDHSYAGIPLWVLIAGVDGEDTYHYEFNNTLADSGYNVIITGSDDYNTTMPISDIEYNDDILVAFMFDWEYLSGDEAPLRLAGPDLMGSQKVSAIVSIELVDLQT